MQSELHLTWGHHGSNSACPAPALLNTELSFFVVMTSVPRFSGRKSWGVLHCGRGWRT